MSNLERCTAAFQILTFRSKSQKPRKKCSSLIFCPGHIFKTGRQACNPIIVGNLIARPVNVGHPSLRVIYRG